jgi:hypothetical protein
MAMTEGLTMLRPLECTGLQPNFRHKLAANGVSIPADFYQPDRQLTAVGMRKGRS